MTARMSLEKDVRFFCYVWLGVYLNLRCKVLECHSGYHLEVLYESVWIVIIK